LSTALTASPGYSDLAAPVPPSIHLAIEDPTATCDGVWSLQPVRPDGSFIRAPKGFHVGSRVIPDLSVVTIYLGKQWQTRLGKAMAAANDAFMRSLDDPNNGFNRLLAQYGAPRQHFLRSVVVPIEQGVLTEGLAKDIASQIAEGVPPDKVRIDVDHPSLLSGWISDLEQLLLDPGHPKKDILYNIVTERGVVLMGNGLSSKHGKGTYLGGEHMVLSPDRQVSMESWSTEDNGISYGDNAIQSITGVESHEIGEDRTNGFGSGGVSGAKGAELYDLTDESGLGGQALLECDRGFAVELAWSRLERAYEAAPASQQDPPKVVATVWGPKMSSRP
jgi:hypothetical protein